MLGDAVCAVDCHPFPRFQSKSRGVLAQEVSGNSGCPFLKR
jgi:hypothetical protein